MYSDGIRISTCNFQIDIELNSLVNVITGDTSVGKTYLISIIRALQNSNRSTILNTNIDLDDIIICNNKQDIQFICQSGIKGMTIIIDRYDILHTDILDKFILSGNNRIILMSHTMYYNLDLHSESLLVLKYIKSEHKFITESILEHLSEKVI